MYWNERYETMSRDELEFLQSEKLQHMLSLIYHNVPFYRNKFQDLGIEPEDFKDISVLSKLPFTVKQDLRDNYPYGMLASPQSQIVRVHSSKGMPYSLIASAKYIA